MTFEVSPEQFEKYEKWRLSRQPNKYAGAIGGRYTWEFLPTSVGVCISVTDSMCGGDTLDLTDYESW